MNENQISQFFDPSVIPEEFRDDYGDYLSQLQAKASVRGWAANDHRRFAAVSIFNWAMQESEMADERLCTAQKFCELFEREQTCLNKGVRSLDFVRECVRRSFGISQVVEFGRKNSRMYWTSPEKIEEIAQALVSVEFTLPLNHGH
ncbi:MAG: hypothetical protein A3A98_03465 [Candidatus Staskawiczbacteria bacterium RIFCSPLOWO2_01_FULL_40_39]|uniref:Uncharacterized protein n=1 Tax=Candidatus Staskawiczbacteria bacterium RIFCSPHIGHO2_01_FULL_39_25 TaxID=1802202 RepID=A0A1G2HQ22_9BACT|nr:MAG: hypothetical protein A2730_02740 [Candidatus Staskawiczbacteria bacterium RIFCSPHIGHO2_01_FULL_39_25]OGZ72872.1 MAG: hypothetical protein A3A98_03465 [Candidatus Staskawiczbacteria bacterium RIFCSPLOWO2_01_FULL_40_39]OGZ75203.1 MAG: hypothetical protein A3I87_00820 [Candidatus Staskawiczbacteria bacterium RIFCSPLOWO2_02_FULL_39_8]